MTNWRVGVIDDHPLCRDAIRVLLKSQGILAEAFADADALMAERAISDWDCVLVDLRLRRTSGWQEIEKLRSHRADLPVLIMTAHLDDQFTARTVNVDSAIPVVLKTATAEQLLSAIQRLIS